MIPKFTPVIHIKNENHALEQANIAFNNGADGIFLIDHARSHNHLKKAYYKVREIFTNKWIGLNFLDLDSIKACEHMPKDADGLWVDDGRVDDSSDTNEEAIRLALHAIENGAGKTWNLFAGTAFKYQKSVQSDFGVAKISSTLFNVVCTSGPGTGSAPDVMKIQTMKYACINKPLAVASGITIDNVSLFEPYVDCFMVSTGISKSFHELDPNKTRQLATLINA